MENQITAKNISPKNKNVPPDPDLLTLLVCPLTKTSLIYNQETNELISETAGLAFPIRNGIPIMLIEEARKIN